ncbi:hypothetical protein A9Q79_04730 [Methylophaga sp. 42_25_T18]|nr:hypothetical protein A9Q79_04730 [Methylophaga sp. 42_25_T18]
MGKVIKIIAGLFVVVMITVVVLVSTVDINQYKPELIKVVEEATGRKLQIGGELAFGLSLVPTVLVEDVKFSNASWGSKPEMLSLNKFEVEVALLPLLSGNIQVNRVILLDPEILLETNKKGLGNWVFAAKKSENKSESSDSESSSTLGIVVNEVHIENATITYNDGMTGQQTVLVIDEITAESDSVNDPLSLIMKVAYNAIPISVEGQLGSVNKLANNDVYPVDLAIEVADAKLEINGQIKKPMKGQGLDIGIQFTVDSLSSLSGLTGGDLPDFGPITLKAKLIDGAGAYSLKALEVKAGNTDLSGDVTVAVLAKQPAITVTLKSNLIDLAELVGDEEQAEAEKKQRLFSQEPLPLAALKSINANVSINAKQIKTSSLVLADTTVNVSLKDGNLSVKPLSTLVAGGKLAGNIALNAQGKTATLSTTLNIAGLEPNQLTDLDDKLTGAKTDVNINVKGSGESVSQIMAGLNGKLLVKVGEGKITDSVMGALGADVLAETLSMLNPFSKSSDGSVLNCAVVNFDIKNGVATTDQGIAISTDQMNIIGSGTINLKTEALDIGIKPEAKEGLGISAGQLAALVRVSGTLANPKPTADATAVLSTGLSVGTAVATGGLSILAQGLLDRGTADADPCATALGQKPATTAKQAPEKTTTTKAVDAVKDAGSAVTDTLKGFFN